MPTALPAVICLLAAAAPAAPPKPTSEDPPATPAFMAGVGAGVGWRPAPASRDVPPRFAPSFTVFLGGSYARPVRFLTLEALGTFGFERYSQSVQAARLVTPAEEVTFEGVRKLTHYDFALMQRVTLHLRAVQAWGAIGAGLGLGYFFTEERTLRPGEARATKPLLLGGAGLDVGVRRDVAIGVSVHHTRLVDVDRYQTSEGSQLDLFGPRLAFRLGVLYRF